MPSSTRTLKEVRELGEDEISLHRGQADHHRGYAVRLRQIGGARQESSQSAGIVVHLPSHGVFKHNTLFIVSMTPDLKESGRYFVSD